MANARKQTPKLDVPLKARWFEIAISVIASIIASAIVATWQLSAMVAKLDNGIADNTRSISNQESAIQQARTIAQGADTVNASQNAQIAVSDARYNDVVRRLDSIEGKLDRAIVEDRRRP